MVKELTVSREDGDIHKHSVQMDQTNEDSTRVKRKIRIMDHPKNLLEILRERIAISQALTDNNITTLPNQ